MMILIDDESYSGLPMMRTLYYIPFMHIWNVHCDMIDKLKPPVERVTDLCFRSNKLMPYELWVLVIWIFATLLDDETPLKSTSICLSISIRRDWTIWHSSKSLHPSCHTSLLSSKILTLCLVLAPEPEKRSLAGWSLPFPIVYLQSLFRYMMIFFLSHDGQHSHWHWWDCPWPGSRIWKYLFCSLLWTSSFDIIDDN